MAVGDYDLKPFTLPVGDGKHTQTRNNDNLLRAKFVAHQADTVAHPTAGTYASRPATGSTNQIYCVTDAPNKGVYVWTGGAWVLIAS